MKLYQALLPLAAAMALAGCQGRGTAEGVIGQAEGVISQVKDQAAVSAPNELKQAEATLAHMKQNYEEREYQAVIDEVPQFNAQIEAMKTTATANNAAAAEWNSLNTEVPKVIEEIQARVDSIKPNALPKDVTKEELDTAKTELETMKSTWAEATAAATAGKAMEATDKARVVQAKAEELKNTLGMNEQLASATPANAG
jgi:chromosome segregation ATPase